MVAQVSSESHKLSKSETPDRQIDRHTHTHTDRHRHKQSLSRPPLSVFLWIPHAQCLGGTDVAVGMAWMPRHRYVFMLRKRHSTRPMTIPPPLHTTKSRIHFCCCFAARGGRKGRRLRVSSDQKQVITHYVSRAQTENNTEGRERGREGQARGTHATYVVPPALSKVWQLELKHVFQQLKRKAAHLFGR